MKTLAEEKYKNKVKVFIPPLQMSVVKHSPDLFSAS